MKTPLHDGVLRLHAHSTLKSLQAYCFRSQSSQICVDLKAISTARLCQAVWDNGFRDEDLRRLARDKTLHRHIEHVIDQLTYSALLKLTLLAWYFEASFLLPSKRLIFFFAQPYEEYWTVCEALCNRYNRLIGQETSFAEFADRLATLLAYLEFVLGLW